MLSCNYHISALWHIHLWLMLESTKMVVLSIVAACLDYCNSLLYAVTISGSCRWHRMHWPESYAKLRDHAVPQKSAIHCIGYHWNNASAISSQFRLTMWRRVKVHRMWHLSLVTMHHLVHWDPWTNSCLAVLTRLLLRLTKHFLLVHQRCGMICLMCFNLCEVLNVTLNANFCPARMLITPSNSRLSHLWFRNRWVINWFCIFCIGCFTDQTASPTKNQRRQSSVGTKHTTTLVKNIWLILLVFWCCKEPVTIFRKGLLQW